MEEPQTGTPQGFGEPKEEKAGQPQNIGYPQEEKKELLRREEIKTMSKDISQLREIEAQKEKERLMALEAQKEQQKTPLPPPFLPTEETLKKFEAEQPKTFAPEIPEEISSSNKNVWARIGIIVIILLVIGGAIYWFLTMRGQPAPDETGQLPVTTTTEEVVEQFEEPAIPPSLFEIQSFQMLTVANLEDVPLLLSQFLATDSTNTGFTRILIKDVINNKYLGLAEFFSAFNINTPAGLLDKLNDEFTLFVYSGNGNNRLGLATGIEDNENFYVLGKSWEPTMENDTEELFASLNEEKTNSPTSFKQAYYKKYPFRYASFSNNKFGICWSAYNYFIWTTSGESMVRTIDSLLK